MSHLSSKSPLKIKNRQQARLLVLVSATAFACLYTFNICQFSRKLNASPPPPQLEIVPSEPPDIANQGNGNPSQTLHQWAETPNEAVATPYDQRLADSAVPFASPKDPTLATEIPAPRAPQPNNVTVPPLAPVPPADTDDEQLVIDIPDARLTTFPRFTTGGNWSRRFVDTPALSFMNPADIVKQDTNATGELKDLLMQWQQSISAGKSSDLFKTPYRLEHALASCTLSPIALVQLGNALDAVEGPNAARYCYKLAIERARKAWVSTPPKNVASNVVTFFEAILPPLAADPESADTLHQTFRVLVAMEQQNSAKRTAAAALYAKTPDSDQASDGVLFDVLANAAAHDLDLAAEDRIDLKWIWANALYRSEKYKECIPVLRELMASPEKSAPVAQSCFYLVECAVATGQNELAQQNLQLWETRYAKPSDAAGTRHLEEDIKRGALVPK